MSYGHRHMGVSATIRWFKDYALTLKELLIALDIGKGIDRQKVMHFLNRKDKNSLLTTHESS